MFFGNFEEGWEGYESCWIDGKCFVLVFDVWFDIMCLEIIVGRCVLVVNDYGLGDMI